MRTMLLNCGSNVSGKAVFGSVVVKLFECSGVLAGVGLGVFLDERFAFVSTTQESLSTSPSSPQPRRPTALLARWRLTATCTSSESALRAPPRPASTVRRLSLEEHRLAVVLGAGKSLSPTLLLHSVRPLLELQPLLELCLIHADNLCGDAGPGGDAGGQPWWRGV